MIREKRGVSGLTFGALDKDSGLGDAADEEIMMMVLSEQEICSMSWERNALVSVFSRLRTFTFF